MNSSGKNLLIVIARDFTPTPGFRYRSDGPKSGEEFREAFLEPHFSNDTNSKITIDFDGSIGYATSFLEEAFGGLARMFGKDVCLARLHFVSEEDPLLIDEVKSYIEDA